MSRFVGTDEQDLETRAAEHRRNRTTVAVINRTTDNNLRSDGTARDDNVDIEPLFFVKTQSLWNQVGQQCLATAFRSNPNFFKGLRVRRWSCAK